MGKKENNDVPVLTLAEFVAQRKRLTGLEEMREALNDAGYELNYLPVHLDAVLAYPKNLVIEQDLSGDYHLTAGGSIYSTEVGLFLADLERFLYDYYVAEFG